jgi:toxin ParE1/3/4
MRFKVAFRPEAEADLTALHDYIVEHSGATRAAGFVDRIETACRNLETFPQRGAPRDDLAPGIRMLVIDGRAMVAYRVEENRVRIVRVFYAGRDFANELFGD